MKTLSLAAILMAATLAMVNPTSAQSEKEVMMTGTIVSTSPDETIIRTEQGNLKCKFKDGVERPANLAPGALVTFWVDEDDADDNAPGEKMEDETYTILRMTVTPAAAPTPPPAAATPPPARAETPAPEPTAVADPVDTDDQLPDTASPLVAIGIMGLLALAGSLGIRRWRRHSTSM
jgi:hypothetical protein